jgi:hypothetical protein
MTENEKVLVMDLVMDRLTKSEFLQKYPVNPQCDRTYIPRMIDDALSRKDGDQLAYVLLIYFVFGCANLNAELLCKVLPGDWHKDHENITSILQNLKDPVSVNSLYDVALAKYPYLEFDDNYALAVKAIWALGDIGNEAARDKLKLLAQSEIEVISENAKYQLSRIRA